MVAKDFLRIPPHKELPKRKQLLKFSLGTPAGSQPHCSSDSSVGEKEEFPQIPSLVCSRILRGESVAKSWAETPDHLDGHATQMGFTTCVAILHRCGKAKSLAEGKRVHVCILETGLERKKVLGNLLVQMYGRCGALQDAVALFDRMQERNLFSWNAMISAYAWNGLAKKALRLFRRMQRTGVTPNKFIFASILSACATKETLVEGRHIHAHIKRSGLESDIVVGTALFNMYGKCGSIDDARMTFDQLPERDLVSWNSMITVYAQHERHKDVHRLYEEMLKEGVLPDRFTLAGVLDACATQEALTTGKLIHTNVLASGLELDVVIGTALINMYGKCGSLKNASRLFERMPERNRATFISILSACANQVALAEGRHMHALMISSGILSDVNLGNALISVYGKCGSFRDACKMFDDMPKRDIISWNAMIAVHAQTGGAKNVLHLCDQMHQEGVVPNAVTFISILSACSHAGLVNEGYQYFLSMERSHGVLPVVDHYNCMVDLLARAGQLDEAEQLISNMPITPTVVSWTSLLGACRMQADVKRAERIAKRVLKIDPGNPAHHVMLANIYAAAGMGNDAAKVMSMLKDMNLENQISCSAMAFKDWVDEDIVNNFSLTDFK